jgi:hypothetical protein
MGKKFSVTKKAQQPGTNRRGWEEIPNLRPGTAGPRSGEEGVR